MKFLIDGIIQNETFPSKLEVPYFPILRSGDGKLLKNEYSKLSKEPIIVHEHCALEMYQARIEKSRFVDLVIFIHSILRSNINSLLIDMSIVLNERLSLIMLFKCPVYESSH